MHLDFLSDRIFIRPVRPRRSLIDNGNRGRVRSVGRRKKSTGTEWYFHCPEIVRGCYPNRASWFTVRCHLSNDFKSSMPCEAGGKRQSENCRCRTNLRMASETLRQPIEESTHLLRSLVFRIRQCDVEREKTLRLKTGIDFLQFQKTTNQKAGSRQQYDRERNFGSYKSTTPPEISTDRSRARQF